MPKVLDEVWATERPTGIEATSARADVSGIRACGGVSAVKRTLHGSVADHTRHASITGGVEFPIPGVSWQPNLELHRWGARCGDPAERWDLKRLGRPGRCERTCRH